MAMIPATKELGASNQPYNPGIAYVPKWEAAIDQPVQDNPFYDEVTKLTRDTGMDSQACHEYKVCGTDLGIPFLLPPDANGVVRIGYLFGDTFQVAGPFLDLPSGADNYRPQVLLSSSMVPQPKQPIIFDGGPGPVENNTAPELLHQNHSLTNDGVGLPNGDIVVSYQYLIDDTGTTPDDPYWHTYNAGLAISYDGGQTFEMPGPLWENNPDNTDPYQMWSMQRDGEYVYIVSVRAGRQPGPMMLFRAPWAQMMDKAAYTYWNGTDWGEKNLAVPIMEGQFGEPSLRKLPDGTWALGYTEYTHGPKIVTQTILDPAQGPEGQWSEPKTHLTWRQLGGLYGGFIHPSSTRDNVILMISSWQTKGSAKDIDDRELVRYDVSHLVVNAE